MGERTADQISLYQSECHQRLRLIDFPTDFVKCGDRYCNDQTHRLIIDKMYSDIVLALSQASSAGRGGERGQRKHRSKTIIGWNKHVSDSHGRARACFQEWNLYGLVGHHRTYL